MFASKEKREKEKWLGSCFLRTFIFCSNLIKYDVLVQQSAFYLFFLTAVSQGFLRYIPLRRLGKGQDKVALSSGFQVTPGQ